MDVATHHQDLTPEVLVRSRGLSTRRATGLSFALLAHPAVQGVRFLSKLAIPWFVTTAEYGEAALAGLILFGLQHAAVCGLDEALVSTPRLSGDLWLAMRRHQMRVGIALALVAVAAGFALQLVAEQRLLGELVVALAPMLWVANLATLPTALLVRERLYASVFVVDLVAVAAFTLLGVASAALGLGPWSLVVAWHANALAACVAAHVLARPRVPAPGGGLEAWSRTRRTGAHFTGAALLGYVGERLDSAAIGFALGRAVLGLYEMAQNLAVVFVNYATSLSERLLFPTLAAHHRARGLGRGYLVALRGTLLVLLPLHLVVAMLAEPLVSTLLPPSWAAAWTILVLLALAAAARCFDVVAVAALKAAGHGRTVFLLGMLRLGACAAGLVLALPHGIIAAAAAVLGSRVASAAVSQTLAWRRLDLARAPRAADLRGACFALVLFVLGFVPLAWSLDRALAGHTVVLLVTQPILALSVWSLARWAIDREAFARELWLARRKLGPPGRGARA